MNDNLSNFKKGVIDGISVALGYFAVSFTIGISASNIGMKWYQSALMSALNYTSAGEAAALSIMKDGGSVWELMASTVVINLRYLLMSAALAVRLAPGTGYGKISFKNSSFFPWQKTTSLNPVRSFRPVSSFANPKS